MINKTPLHIKNIKSNFFLLCITLLLLIIFITTTIRFSLRGKAESIDVTIKLTLQGNFESIKNSSYKTRVMFYTQNTKMKDLPIQNLEREEGNNFKLQLSLNDLDLNEPYSIFIKPEKFLGKVFCSDQIASLDCKIPQIILNKGQNTLDFKKYSLSAGDIAPQDGKIDSFDFSKIIRDIGKASEGLLESDINNDGIVNALDYILAVNHPNLQKLEDDAIAFEKITPMPSPITPTLTPEDTPTLTPTITSTPTPTITLTPTITSTPTITPTGTIITPTVSITPTPSKTPTPTLTPTPTAIRTPTPTPFVKPTKTPTPTPTVYRPPVFLEKSGICTTTLKGFANVNLGIFGTQCKKIDNEKHYYCVNSQADCNPNKCVEVFKNTMKQSLDFCSNSIATLDDQYTQISCTTDFSADYCTPLPVPACEDNRDNC